MSAIDWIQATYTGLKEAEFVKSITNSTNIKNSAKNAYFKVTEALAKGFSQELWNITAFYETLKPAQNAIKNKYYSFFGNKTN